MNQRVAEIVKILNTAEQATRIADLSAHFSVSQRTIRNDLNEINGLLQEAGIGKLVLQSGGTIVLPEGFDRFPGAIGVGDYYAYKLSKEERKKIAAAILVNSPEYTTLNEIAERLFVSRATVINDLDDIKAFIHKHDLEVISYPNKGLRVDGRESDKRRFLLTLLSGTASDQTDVVAQHISVQAGNRVILQKIINEQEHAHGSFLTDTSFRRILLYLGIMINRNLQGEFLEAQPRLENTRYAMAQDILRYVVQYCNVTVTENDIHFLTAMLTRARYMHHVTRRNNAIMVQVMTRQFIKRVSEALGVSLNTDYDFFETLSNHLASVFSSPPVAYAEHDVLEEVLKENQDVVEIVRSQTSLLSRCAGREITDMELSYIAVHVCAALEREKNKEIAFHVILACHAGIGTSRLLLEKLKNHFHFQIVDIISAHDARNVPADRADFMISTVPLKDCKMDYVVVSAAFNDRDYVRVGNKIEALRNSRHLPSRMGEKGPSAKGMIEKLGPIVYDMVPEQAPELMKQIRRTVHSYFNQSLEADSEIFSPYLHHLLSRDNIELDVPCTDWRDAVRKSAQAMLERGYIEACYIDAMIRNIEENGPYIVISKGFAVPHEGVDQGSVRIGMHLIRLKEPVPFDADELDPVEFVCCLSAVDHKTHLKAFFNLVNMLRDDSFKEQLRTCSTPEEAAGVIERYEYSVID